MTAAVLHGGSTASKQKGCTAAQAMIYCRKLGSAAGHLPYGAPHAPEEDLHRNTSKRNVHHHGGRYAGTGVVGQITLLLACPPSDSALRHCNHTLAGPRAQWQGRRRSRLPSTHSVPVRCPLLH